MILAAPHPADMLDEIVAHLGAAISQSLPSDDQIIIAHVREAHALARQLSLAQRRVEIPASLKTTVFIGEDA